ncbi:hypothetical protein [Sinorhizobium meliloti]|uniref:hypothetical protein n=1 Tax=Rhizobium meliloti TaxID=382 RepID=UPI000FD8DEB1|nr:hypothetical protein [Sinorhizobium meliloti]RVL04751.1 hypothetical protein CN152_04285 [Sinorhizobium meliloti]RVN50618.1 hypothetical protein CN113_04800 [Sinorhizobium meliloti]
MHTTNHWALELVASESESRGWAASFKPPFDPYLETIHGADKSRLVLRSSEFDGLAEPNDVYFRGKEILRLLNTTMEGFRPATPGAVAKFEGEGGPKFFHVLEAVSISSSTTFGVAEIIVRDKNGKVVESPPSASRQQKWMEAARLDSHIAAAMEHLSGEPDWVGLYKAYEALHASALAASAISNNEKARIRRTANSEKRHWQKDAELVPIPIGEARTLLKKWLTAAINEVVGAGSPSTDA